jgi:hypothetical protein
MNIGEFLRVRTSEKEFPATNVLQTRITEALRDDKADEAEQLAAALAFAVLDMEVALVNAHAERMKLKAPTCSSWKRESSTPTSNLTIHGTSSDPMTHRLITAYRAGRAAFPHTLANPYAGPNDLAAARMWRLDGRKPATNREGSRLRRRR